MLDTIKNVFIPAIKDSIKETCIEMINDTLYREPVDLSESAPGAFNGKRIRVIGRCITIY